MEGDYERTSPPSSDNRHFVTIRAKPGSDNVFTWRNKDGDQGQLLFTKAEENGAVLVFLQASGTFEIVSNKNCSQVVAVCRWGVHNTITQQLGFLSQTRLRLKDPMECIQSRIQVTLLSFTRNCPNRLGYSFAHLRLKTETLCFNRRTRTNCSGKVREIESGSWER